MEEEKTGLEILEHFIFKETEHHIHILWVDNHPWFRASDIGDILNIKRIRNSIVDFDEDEKGAQKIATPGGPQNILFLTEQGVFRLIFHSRKPLAKPLQKWVANLLKEVQRKGQIEIRNLREELQNEKARNEKSIREAQQEVILSFYHEKPIVYFGWIKNIEDKMLVKIGSTKDVKRTFLQRHQSDYGEMTLMKAFECLGNVHFEYFILHHKLVKTFLYREPVKINGGKSIETILVSKNELEKIFRMAQKYLPQFTQLPDDIQEDVFWLKEQVQNVKELENSVRTLSLQQNNFHQEIKEIIPFSKNLLNHFVNKQKLPLTVIGNMANISGQAVRKRCKKLDIPIPKKKKSPFKFHVTKETLHDLVHNQKLSWAELGRKYGVAPSSITKRCKKLGISTKREMPEKQKTKRIRTAGTGNCTVCNTKVTNRAHLCKNCEEDSRPKKFDVSKEYLYDMVHVQKLPFTTIGRKYGVSDNAIRKRCKSFGIETKRK